MLGLIPVTIDFLFFHIKNKQLIESKLARFDGLVRNIHDKGNSLMSSSVLSRIDKEISVLLKMNSNMLTLPALQNFEYIREVLSRVLQRVMEPEDKYITLSRLDFWTATPNEYLNFINVNKEAVEDNQKLVDRIIVLSKDLLHKPKVDSGFSSEQQELIQVINNFSNNVEHDFNHYAALKTLLYFADEYEQIKDFLLSVIIIKKNYRDIMFVQVRDLENKDIKNPSIDIKYFEFDNWDMPETGKADTFITINSLLEHITKLLATKGSNEELSQLIRYLRQYKLCFAKLSSIYDKGNSGMRLATIDLNKCDLFDLKMISEHFNIKNSTRD